MRRLTFFLCGLLLSTLASAQFVDSEAMSILNKTAEKIKKTTGIKGEFELTVSNAQMEKKQTFPGTFLLKGDKFKMNLNNIETYFDGQTQWVYMIDNKEVTISTPTSDELQDVNPMLLLSSYKKDYQIKKDEDVTLGGKACHCIKIYPVKKDSPYFQISFIIEKTTLVPQKIEARSRDGLTTTVRMKQFSDNQNLTNAAFIYQSKNGVEIIDLR